MPTPEALARAALDQAHAADPGRIDGQPAELVHADRIERWVARLVDRPGPALALAARCQHLERWVIPRASFPIDRPGYLQWRRAVQQRQGARANAILLDAGCAAELAGHVAMLVAKNAPKNDPDGQALEDAACLAFLEDELAAFAAQHAEYPEDKFTGIIRKTWAKMSPRARELALALPLRADLRALVETALAG